ncbi:glucose-6-phosphate dehydrogenase [Anaerobacillus isosaccharinicus]|uniref:Glucose-6-phosphate 1-dehydrogenase n=1 Tax=Anaerobacillus isosaccharinicus TaxID=1532552 RepID=A0A1S2M8N8_9BACI|nr:glucose-6-phosphate dehydrogenase [Anaerobacillus isosaccharinicus]MBA5587221.1 glucose-6-phosphate dehydrogenase [Anaerobacillus isosaccharinicus]QOY34585.1 glucose-6-phosphate dehydrogenase [Anaerobacillus isosaccharinicus]
MQKEENNKCVIVIFGATGDLAKRKLFPSIYNLYKKGSLSENFAIVGAARREWSDNTFRENVATSIQDSKINVDADLDDFLKHFHYLSFDVTNTSSYQNLHELINELDEQFNIPGNRIFYMAMAPQFFGTIASYLKSNEVTTTIGWSRLIIEKPFGHNLESAQKLNIDLREAFAEDEIYRIDHYLGKEMVQNIEVIRFANAIFEPLWNNRYISNIQVTSSESLGVEDRGGYYDHAGALRDMVQNHMLQMVALLAMEPPNRLTTEEVRTEKIKALRALRPMKSEDVDRYFVRGQYGRGMVNGKEVNGYREESNVDPNSATETFVAGKLLIDNFRWAGVPFYIRTGKRMTEKSTKIVIEFKELPMNLYYKSKDEMHPNLLIIHIQQDEGLSIVLNGKKVALSGETTPVKLDYCSSCQDVLNTPEAYEKLLYDCILGDATNFTHWDEVSLSWSFVDTISKVWENSIPTDFPNYEAQSMGPKISDKLLADDGFHWWPISDDSPYSILKGENINENV